MLTISNDNLPQTCLSYIPFRVACLDTIERIVLAQQIGESGVEGFGFLTEVPFLRHVPTHVQLDLLGATWARHLAEEKHEATLVDEAVLYATCEVSARLVQDDPSTVQRMLSNGPLGIDVSVDQFLATEIRRLHLQMSIEGDFLLISQFEDIPPTEAQALKSEFRLDNQRLDEMFDVLGRWRISPLFHQHLAGLLTPREIVTAVTAISSAARGLQRGAKS